MTRSGTFLRIILWIYNIFFKLSVKNTQIVSKYFQKRALSDLFFSIWDSSPCILIRL